MLYLHIEREIIQERPVRSASIGSGFKRVLFLV